MTSAARYESVCEAGAAITQALAGDDVLSVVARRVAEALGVWECDLYEYYPASETLLCSATWAPELSDDAVAWIGGTLSLSERPWYRSVIADRACVEAYVDDPGLVVPDRAEMERWGERSAMAAPLVYGDQVIGCMTLIETREARRFSEEDRELVTLLAGPVAVAIHNARLFHFQEQQNRHLASLLDISRAIASSVTLDDCLAHICKTSAKALDTSACLIYEYDPDRDTVLLRAVSSSGAGEPTADVEHGVCPFDDEPSDGEMLSRAQVVQRTVSDSTLSAAARAAMQARGDKTCVLVPLVVDDEPMGLLVLVESTRERIFSPDEMELARALGEQAATTILHARLFRRGERQNRRLLALLETSRVLVSSLDAAAVLGEVRREAAGLFETSGDDAVSIVIRRGEAFYPFDAAGSLDDIETEGDAAVELDELRRRAVTELVPCASGDGGPSRLIVPLVLADVAEGLLDVRLTDGRSFSADELELLQILAGQAAAALAYAGLYRVLERQAITDGLTGLHNHRYFYERLTQEVARARRYALPLSLLMIDIDDFKQFNDRFGHPTGDLVLTEVGRILTTHVRRGIDIAARYGGEEFVVLLPNTSRDGAEVAGARLARELAALPGGRVVPPAHESGAVEVSQRIRVSVATASLPGVDADAHITVSVGVSCSHGAGAADDLVREADDALYLAKRLGKNRVEVFGE